MAITSVLIANRGEIAVRIARACRDHGVRSVAVYAEPDRDALHVRVADEAYALGGTTPADSYLLQDRLIEVAKAAGADAVHPGYGFLAENARLRADRSSTPALTWIGPGPAAIDSLGDKVKARHIALAANAPLVPGTTDPVAGTRRGRRLRARARAAGGDQGRVRRRRARPEGRAHPRGDPRAVRVRGARGGHRVRARRVLRRTLPRPPAARGDPVPGRHPRHRRRRLHPRLLPAAPQPEARRGGPGPVPHRGAAHRAGARVQGDPDRRRVRRRRHLRVPHRPRRLHLLPRGQHPPAGRAPRLRGGHRHRPGARAAAHRRRPPPRLRRPGPARPLHRVPHQRRGPRPRVPARPRHRDRDDRPHRSRGALGRRHRRRRHRRRARSTR